MIITGAQLVEEALRQPGYFIKAILNGSGAIFFPGKTEHCAVKQPGLSYEDEYKGNALAAIVTGGRIEIRNHRGFSEQRVMTIMRALLSIPELRCLQGMPVLYRGKSLEGRTSVGTNEWI